MILSTDDRALIIAMAKRGRGNDQIVADMHRPGLTKNFVAQIISRARCDGVVFPYRPRGEYKQRKPRAVPDGTSVSLSVVVDKKSLDYLQTVGARRWLNPERIAEAILETVARDDIADAVLDDGVTS